MMEQRGQMAQVLADLGEYGRRSMRNMGDGVRDARKMAQQLSAMVPPSVDEAAGVVSSFMPGFGVMEAMRLGSQAGRDWREGRYADALGGFADALDAPMGEVLWAVPGGGIVKRAAR